MPKTERRSSRKSDTIADNILNKELQQVMNSIRARVDNKAAAEWEAARRADELEKFLDRAEIPKRIVSTWKKRAYSKSLFGKLLSAAAASDLVIVGREFDRTVVAAYMLCPWDTDEGCQGIWRKAIDVAQYSMDGNKGEAQAKVEAKRAFNTSLLVIDGCGRENPKLNSIIDRLLIDRWEGERKTIAILAGSVTLNQLYPEISETARKDIRIVA